MWVHLDRMVFHSLHGVNPEERVVGRRFEINLSVEVEDPTGILEDKLEETVDYAALYRIVSEVAGRPQYLLETIAQKIALRVNAESDKVLRSRVEVSKLDPPLGGLCERARVVLEVSA